MFWSSSDVQWRNLCICNTNTHKKFYKNSPQETSNVTFTFFDCEDLVLENLIAPALLFLLKFCMDPTKLPTIDMFAYVMLHVLDANTHSLCPYTVGFYFPPLDSMLSPTVSHNLHHALNMGHYTVWPLHQLKGIFMYDNRDKVHVDGSLALDWATYNRVFNTNFPEGRGVKVEWSKSKSNVLAWMQLKKSLVFYLPTSVWYIRNNLLE